MIVAIILKIIKARKTVYAQVSIHVMNITTAISSHDLILKSQGGW